LQNVLNPKLWLEKYPEINDYGLLGYRTLTEDQKASNARKLAKRVRMEHVFGHMETAMGGMMIHTIGFARAKVKMMF
jgi:Transposase DDE domain